MAVVLVAAVATAGGALARAGDASAAVSPPVITEPFKPVLACNRNTTIGMEGCGEHKVLAADRQLNADVGVIFDLLTSAGSRRDFVFAQTTWVSYRNADCRSQSDVYSGGSEQAVVYVLCLAAGDRLRRQNLKGFFTSLTQAQGNVPTFP